MILFPAVAVWGGSRRRSRRLLLGLLYAAAAPGCIRRFGGSEASLVASGIRLKAHTVLAEMREVVSMPVTVLVCQSDAFGSVLERNKIAKRGDW